MMESGGHTPAVEYTKIARELTTPDQEFVNRLMDCYISGIGEPEDGNAGYPKIVHNHHIGGHRSEHYTNSPFLMDNEDIPFELLEAGISRNYHNFLPPIRLQAAENEEHISGRTRTYWQQLALQILKRAQRQSFELITEQEQEEANNKKREGYKPTPQGPNDVVTEYWLREGHTGPLAIPVTIKKLRQLAGPAIMHVNNGGEKHPLHFQIDTAHRGQTSTEITEDAVNLINAAKKELRDAISAVLMDTEQIRQIQKTLEVRGRFKAKVMLKEEITKVENIRKTVENPRETARFIGLMKQAAKKLGHNDVDIELLSSEDAVLLGAMGLYTPAQGEKRATIGLQYSKYGTTDTWNLQDHMETLAHELAHHQMVKLEAKDHESHGVAHSAITAEYIKKLNKFDVVVKRNNGRIEITFVEDTEDHDRLLQSISELIDRQLAQLQPAAAQPRPKPTTAQPTAKPRPAAQPQPKPTTTQPKRSGGKSIMEVLFGTKKK